ncbi:hypothetical protein Bca4012_034919 [Brassica carinata]
MRIDMVLELQDQFLLRHTCSFADNSLFSFAKPRSNMRKPQDSFKDFSRNVGMAVFEMRKLIDTPIIFKGDAKVFREDTGVRRETRDEHHKKKINVLISDQVLVFFFSFGVEFF